jgi:hypothetical protein
MKIDPSEVKTIKNIGSLHNEDVKMVATKGGLFLALGKKSKYKKDYEALAAGSHPALVMHQLEKEFKHDFHQTLAKSEADQLPEVKELDCSVKGLSMFSLKKNTDIDVVIAKFGVEVCKCECEVNGNDLKIKKIDYRVGFTPDMKDVLRSEMNKGLIQTAKNENIDQVVK